MKEVQLQISKKLTTDIYVLVPDDFDLNKITRLTYISAIRKAALDQDVDWSLADDDYDMDTLEVDSFELGVGAYEPTDISEYLKAIDEEVEKRRAEWQASKQAKESKK